MASSGLFARFFLCALLCALTGPTFAEGEPEGEADLVDSLVVDVDSDGEVDRGDTIEYRVMIRSTGTRDIENSELSIPLDEGLTLVPDSLMIGPIATEDSIFQNISETSVIPVLTNDRDVDGSLVPASVVVVQAPTAGMATVNPTNGDISFTSTEAAWPDTLTYTVADDDGLVSSEATVYLYVNTCPVAQDDAVSVGESMTLNGDVFADNGSGADSDVDAFSNRYITKVNGTSGVTGSQITLPSGALLVLNFGGTFFYDPNGQFEGLTGADDDTDTFTYEMTDGYCTATATVTVTIDGANDCPVAKADAITTDEDTAAMGNVLSDNGSGADSDADTGATLTISEVNGAAGDVGMTIALGSGAQLTLNAGGTFTYDPNGAFDALGAGQDDTDSFTYTVSDGTCSDTATATITINGVNDAPTAAAKSANGLGNLELVGNTGGLDASATASPAQTASVSLLTGAADVDTASGSLSVVPATGMSTKGGGFAVFADGSFLYTAPAGLANTTDTFPYTITDGSANSSAATVTVTLGDLVWFINNSAGGSGGTGTSADPFLTTADFNAANGGGAGMPAAGDRIYLDAGAGAYTSGITLIDDQVLEGEGVALVVDSITLATAGSSPTISSTTNHGVSLGSGNTIRGFNVTDTPGFFKINGTAAGTLTADTIALTGTGGAIQIATSAAFGSGVTFSTLESTSSPGAGIDLTGVTGTLGISSFGSGISGTADASPAINVSGGTVSFTYGGGVSKSNTGALVSVSGGHASGTLLFQTTALSATGGTGLQFDNADGTYTFNSTVTLNGGDAGIDITNLSDGNFTFTDAPITNPVGAALVITSGSGTVSHAGDISKTSSGRLIFIQSRIGGSITVSGNLSSTSSATGILIQNNSGGVHTFSGATKTLSTSSTAFTLNNCAGSTTSFTNGGLAITTSAGTGISAASPGTFTVSGAGNSIHATGGPALDVDDSTFTGTFTTLTAVNSSAQGIDLSNLLASSSLTVSGATTVTAPTGAGINIDDVEAGSTLTFGDFGVTNRGSHGLSIRDFDGTSLTFDDVDITNGLNVGGNGVLVQTSGGGATSTGAITFASLDISSTNATVDRTDAGGDSFPDNETDDGHGVRLVDHTGGFTVTGDGTQANGGTIQNIEGDGFSLIRSGGLNLDEITINNIGTANQAANSVDNAGIWAFNLVGTNQVSNSTISRFQDGATPGSSSRGVSIVNSGVSFTSFRSTDTTYFNDNTLYGDDAIQLLTYNTVSGALTVDSAVNLGQGANTSDFYQISGMAVQVLQLGAGTLTTSISDTTFRDTIATGGLGGIDLSSSGSGTMSNTIDECRFLALCPGGVNNGGVVNLFAGGTVDYDATVNNCIFGSASQPTSEGRGAIRASTDTDVAAVVTDFDITITNNTIDDTAREAISLLPDGPAVPSASGRTMDFTISGNTIGATTAVANDFGLGREGIEFRAQGDAKIVNFAFLNNAITNHVDSSSDETADFDVEGSTTVNLTLRGNSFSQTGFPGTADSVDVATETPTVTACLDMNSANSSPNTCPNGITITQTAGIFSIEDIGGSAISSATVGTFIEARNTGTAAVTGTFESCNDH